VRHENTTSAIVQYFLYCGDRCPDPVVIGDVKTFIQGHIKVYTDEGAFSFEVDVGMVFIGKI